MANEDKLLQQGYELYKEACKIYDDVEAAGFGIEGNLVSSAW